MFSVIFEIVCNLLRVFSFPAAFSLFTLDESDSVLIPSVDISFVVCICPLLLLDSAGLSFEITLEDDSETLDDAVFCTVFVLFPFEVFAERLGEESIICCNLKNNFSLIYYTKKV